MPHRVRVISAETGTEDKTVKTTEWNGIRLAIWHHLQTAANQIVIKANAVDVIKINMIGPPGTGKSTLADSLAHMIHKRSMEMFKTPFAVRKFGRKQLLNFDETLNKLSPANYVMIFDDVSIFNKSSNSEKLANVKETFTEIRHKFGDTSVKIIIILNFHYTLGMDKYLRGSNFAFYTDIASNELENMQRIVGVRHTNDLLSYQRLVNQAQVNQKFEIRISQKGQPLHFVYREPFIPVLFQASNSLRLILSPKREWIDPNCIVCNSAPPEKEESIVITPNAQKLASILESDFPKQVVKLAVKLKLHQNGVNVFPSNIKKAQIYLEKYLSANPGITLFDIANYYNFEDRRTHLAKNPDKSYWQKKSEDLNFDPFTGEKLDEKTKRDLLLS